MVSRATEKVKSTLGHNALYLSTILRYMLPLYKGYYNSFVKKRLEFDSLRKLN